MYRWPTTDRETLQAHLLAMYPTAGFAQEQHFVQVIRPAMTLTRTATQPGQMRRSGIRWLTTYHPSMTA